MRVSFRPVRLYLDEVEAIFEALSQAGGSLKVRVDRFEFDSPAELEKHSQKIVNQLYVRSDDPFIQVDFDPYGASVYSSDDDALSRGIVDRVREIVVPNQRRLAWLSLYGVVPQLFGWASVTGGAVAAAKSVWWGLALAVIAAVAAGSWWIAAYRSDTKRHSVIHLIHRAAAPSFLQRNRDQLVVLAISNLLVGAVTFVATYFATSR